MLLRRILGVLLLTLAFPAMAWAQYTTVTGTLKDANGSLYSQGTYYVNFYDPGTSGQQPLLNGSKFQTSYPGLTIDSFGNFSVTLPDNNVIASSSGATGTQWIFCFSSVFYPSVNKAFQFCYQTTVTGASMNLTATLTPLAPTLPVITGGSPVSINSSIITNPNFTSGGNVSFTVTGPNTITANATGSGFPGNPLNCPQFNVSGIFATVLAANGFCLGGTDNASSPTYISFPINSLYSGMNPEIDITSPVYGGRATTSYIIATGTISGGTANLILTSSPAFINGDGIYVINAGATNTTSPISTMTITPSEPKNIMGTGLDVASPTGSTSYQYMAVVQREGVGQTPQAAFTTITNGLASLGPQSCSLASWTRSGISITFTTTGSGCAPSNIASGTRVVIAGESDQTVNGYMPVSGINSGSNQFTVVGGSSVAGGAATSGSGGGTVTWWQSNQITVTIPTGTWRVLFYGGAGSATGLIGESTVIVAGESTYSWDDYGANYHIAAGDAGTGVPTSAPVSSTTNDALVTTICSGGGTSNLTLCANATNTATAQTVGIDQTPNILAAAEAFKAGSVAPTIVLPATVSDTAFYVTTPLDFNAAGIQKIRVLQRGAVGLYAPVMDAFETMTWGGDHLGFSSTGLGGFFVTTNITLTCATYPCFVFQYLGAIDELHDLDVSHPYDNSFNIQVSGQAGNFTAYNLNIVAGAQDGNDNLGVGIGLYGVYWANLRNIFFGNSMGAYTSTTPSLLASNGLGIEATNGTGEVSCDGCFFSSKGIARSQSNGSGGSFNLTNLHAQGLFQPMVTIDDVSGSGDSISIGPGSLCDTCHEAILANETFGNKFVAIANSSLPNNPNLLVVGFPMILNTYGVSSFSVNPANNGQNYDGVITTVPGSSNPYSPWGTPVQSAQPSYAYQIMNMGIVFPTFWGVSWPFSTQASFVSITPASGGSVPVGTQSYEVTTVGLDGVETAINPTGATCVTTIGTQSCVVVINSVSMQQGWNLYRCSSGCGSLSNYGRVNTTLITTSTYTDTVAFAGNTPPQFSMGGYQSLTANGLYTPFISALQIGQTVYAADEFGTLDQKFNACVTAAIAIKGTCDATGLSGTQSITATLVCGDSSFDPVTCIFPTSGQWNCNMTNNTDCFDQYAGSYAYAKSVNGSPTFLINVSNCASVPCLSYIYRTITGGLSGSCYLRLDGVKFNNAANAATSSTVGALLTGLCDQAGWWGVNISDNFDATVAQVTNSAYAVVNGSNFSARGVGGIPFEVSATTGNSVVGLRMFEDVLESAGPGQPTFNCIDASVNTSSVYMWGTNEESTSSDTTTNLNQNSGCALISSKGMHVRIVPSGWAASIWSQTNSGNGAMDIGDGDVLVNGGQQQVKWFVDSNGRSCPNTPCTTMTDPRGLALDVHTSYTTNMSGTTAGVAIWNMPHQNPSDKIFYVWLSGYENTTATAQTITFPTPFNGINGVVTVTGSCTGVTTNLTTLTLPSSMGASQSGLCKVEGF